MLWRCGAEYGAVLLCCCGCNGAVVQWCRGAILLQCGAVVLWCNGAAGGDVILWCFGAVNTLVLRYHGVMWCYVVLCGAIVLCACGCCGCCGPPRPRLLPPHAMLPHLPQLARLLVHVTQPEANWSCTNSGSVWGGHSVEHYDRAVWGGGTCWAAYGHTPDPQHTLCLPQPTWRAGRALGPQGRIPPHTRSWGWYPTRSHTQAAERAQCTQRIRDSPRSRLEQGGNRNKLRAKARERKGSV